MRKRRRINPYRVGALAVFLCLAVLLGVLLFSGEAPTNSPSENTELLPAPEANTMPEKVEKPHVVSSASVGVVGDVLIHNPVHAAAKQSDGSYDFTNNYTYVSEYLKKYDYAVANLEVTLAGKNPVVGSYPSGYPTFNAPDSVVDALKGAGVDMLLTANNHSNDTRGQGLIRTVQIVREKGLEYLGTRDTTEENFYKVKDINGIKVGMACFTYSTVNANGVKALNGITMTKDTSPLVSSFTYADLPGFYAEAESAIAQMKENGAEFIMFYVHWGNEYQLSPNTNQKNIAKKLCELGVDVLVGGHPHVIQPFETITAENGNETLCIYSVGNFVSNQRKHEMGGIAAGEAGYTEDGMIFGVTFQRWSDGSVSIGGVEITPLWVNMENRQGKRVYQVVPLDAAASDWTKFELNTTTLKYAKDSYKRTMSLVGKGLNAARTALGLSEVPLTVS